MKFVADRTTGKLAKKLRALGFDVVFWAGEPAEEATRAARAQGRMLLTRSRRIPKGLRAAVLESDDPREQVREILDSLGLTPPEGQFFSRCLLCNEVLLPAGREEVEGKVPDFIHRAHDAFRRCPRCSRIYWPGTHPRRMRKEMAPALGQGAGSSTSSTRRTEG